MPKGKLCSVEVKARAAPPAPAGRALLLKLLNSSCSRCSGNRDHADQFLANINIAAGCGPSAHHEIAAEVATVGGRTVWRYLARMVDEGRPSAKKRGRGTVYCKPGD